jgi:hypothetical protein
MQSKQIFIDHQIPLMVPTFVGTDTPLTSGQVYYQMSLVVTCKENNYPLKHQYMWQEIEAMNVPSVNKYRSLPVLWNII